MLPVVPMKMMNIIISPGTPNEISASVSHSYDDAEACLIDGLMRLSSSDLEFVDDQVVGIRFRDINISKDVTIVNAYLQFTVDETKGSDTRTNLNIHVQAADDAQAFSTSKYGISLVNSQRSGTRSDGA